jgi:ADP-heptose:LPS heptosyltransferase
VESGALHLRRVSPFIKRVLIPCDMGIGNLVMYLPALKAIKDASDKLEITVVVSAKYEVNLSLLTEIAPGLINNSITIKNRFKFLYYIKSLLQVKPNYIVVRFNSNTKWFMLSALLCRLVHGTKIIGHSSSDLWTNKFNYFINRKVPVSCDHEAINYLNLSNRLRADIGVEKLDRLPKINSGVDLIDETYLNTLLPNCDSSKLIVFNASSSPFQKWKRWPVEHWKDLIRVLVAKGFTVVAVGGNEDIELHKEILQVYPTHSVHNLCGCLNFSKTISLIATAKLVIGADTALLHLAGLTSTNIIGIFGPTDELRTSPISKNFTLLRSKNCKGRCFTLADNRGHERCNYHACMASLLPAEIEDYINKIVTKC